MLSCNSWKRCPCQAPAQPKSRKPPYNGKSADLAVWAPGLTRAIVAAIQNCSQWFRVSKSKLEEWREHVRNNHQPFRKDEKRR